jgi:hypothetical protein
LPGIALALGVMGFWPSPTVEPARGQQPTPSPPPPAAGAVYGSRPAAVGVYGGWPGYSGGGTAAGNALNGMSSVISAAGDYNLSTSQAAVNMTQADRNNIQNRQMATDTYFQMRAVNRAARAAEAGPKPTEEQLVRMARQGVPKPLSTQAVDPVSGKINWYSVLQADGFAAPRTEVDQLFAKRARDGGLDYADQAAVREAIDGMADLLKSMIRDIPPRDYTVSKSFLRSLVYAASGSNLY